MNKRVIAIIVTLAVLIVGAVGVYALTRPGDSPATEGSSSQSGPAAESPAPSAEATDDSVDAAASGTYVEYSDTAIANAEGRIFLFFHAPWCPQCRSLEADIFAAGVPAGITIIKVDYDSHQDLRQKYGVTQQTTMVEVDAAGNGLQNYLAYSDPRLQTVLDAML